MQYFCTPAFKKEINNLSKNNSYLNIATDFIEEALIDNIEANEYAQSGTKIAGSATRPFIKKRIKGRGKYRTYFLIIPHPGLVFFGTIYPKFGSKRIDSLTRQEEKNLLREIINCIKSIDLLEMIVINKKITFKKVMKINLK